jgi:L-fuconolactonase
MFIDAPQHLWGRDEAGRNWPTQDLAPIYRDFGPSDLLPVLREHGVDATVLVQSMECEGETLRMLDMAEHAPWIAGVVGWTDLKAVDAPDRIARLAQAPKLRGLRPMLQGLDDDDWIGDPALAPAIKAMLARGLVFDALVQPRHLPGLLSFACSFPRLPIVINHAAKPAIASREASDWESGLARLAAQPNVVCKLSGLVTEAGPGWQARDLQPWIAHVLRCFGPQRILWGSDWPVLNLAADYAGWIQTCRAMLDHLDGAERAAIFGGNACRVYRLSPTKFQASLKPSA